MEFVKVFPELAIFGRYQKLIYFFVLLPCQVTFYIHLYSHIFLTYQPDHWCSVLVDGALDDQEDASNSSSLENVTLSPRPFLHRRESLRRFFYIPHRGLIDRKKLGGVHTLNDYTSGYDTCNQFNATFSVIDQFHRLVLPYIGQLSGNETLLDIVESSNHSFQLSPPPIIQCERNVWSYNRTSLLADETLVTKWHLVCSREWMQTLPLVALFGGLLFAGLLHNTLVQRMGNRSLFFVCILLQNLSVVGGSFMPEFWQFCACRFITGATLHATVQVPIDLMIEFAGVRVMSQIVFFNESIRLIGALVLATISEHIVDYRQLSLAISIPFTVLLFFYCSFPESLKHLLIVGDVERLEKTITSIAHTNLEYCDVELDDSIKRRIYVELELYRELVLALLIPEPTPSIPLRENVENNNRRMSNTSSLVENFVKSLQAGNNSMIEEMGANTNSVTKEDDEIETITSIATQKPDSALDFLEFSSEGLDGSAVQASSSSSSSRQTVPSSLSSQLNHSVSISAILRMPNLRMKFLILATLSAIQFPIYFSFAFFVADFADSSHSNFGTNSVFNLFTLNITLNLIGVWLTYGCIHCNFGRKFTFFFANILATGFVLWTGFALGSHENRTLVMILYCVAKLFQTVCYCVLQVWLYELLPPSASCSSLVRYCYIISTLSLNALPALLHITKQECRLCINVQNCGDLSINCHYLLAGVGLFLSTWLSLFLPETGSVERLPANLQEVELYSQWATSASPSSALSSSSTATTNSSITTNAGSSQSSDSSTNNRASKWRSLGGLFNFQPPPNVRPGILKKSSSTLPQYSSSKESAIQRRKRQLDGILEQKFARVTSDCANKTAYNSVCNQFLHHTSPSFMSGETFVYCDNSTTTPAAEEADMALTKDGNLTAMPTQSGRNQSSVFQPATTTMGAIGTGFWFGALADGVASGLPLLNYINPTAGNVTNAQPLDVPIGRAFKHADEHQQSSLTQNGVAFAEDGHGWFDLQMAPSSNVQLVDVELNPFSTISALDADDGVLFDDSGNLSQALAFEMDLSHPIILDI